MSNTTLPAETKLTYRMQQLAHEPAHPVADVDLSGSDRFEPRQYFGLTKREMIAIAAMQGYIAAGSNGMPDPASIVERAMRTADLLLEELSK